jgi:cation-transporting P-type ATPase 13A2
VREMKKWKKINNKIQADVGLSLSSEAEATMAAPFTAISASPGSFVTLLKEGRAALVTSFQCFKYVVFYSLIQFFGLEILYGHCTKFSDWSYLMQDLFTVLPLAIAMSRTEPALFLSHSRPPGVLFSFQPLMSLIGHSLLIFFTQLLGVAILHNTPGYIPNPKQHDGLPLVTHEAYFFQHLAIFQCIFTAIALSLGRPFRKEFWSNYLFTILLLLASVFEVWLMVAQPTAVIEYFELPHVPVSIIFSCFVLGYVYGVCAILFEWWILKSNHSLHSFLKLYF